MIVGWYFFLTFFNILDAIPTTSVIRSSIGLILTLLLLFVHLVTTYNRSNKESVELENRFTSILAPYKQETKILNEIGRRLYTTSPTFSKLTIEVEQAANPDQRLLVISKFEPMFPTSSSAPIQNDGQTKVYN